MSVVRKTVGKNDPKDACKGKIRRRLCVWCVRTHTRAFWKGRKFSPGQQGVKMQFKGAKSVGMTDVGVFLTQTRQCLHTKLSSPVRHVFAYWCEHYWLLNPGFLPVTLSFFSHTKRKGVAWHITLSTWLPIFDPSLLTVPVSCALFTF